MAWDGNNATISSHSSRNYMYGDKIFILDEITPENCAYLIGDMSAFVFNEQNFGKKLNIIINSPGGVVDTMFNIIGLINIAKLANIEVTTFVFGSAASAASMIAVHGTVRLMNKYSTHLIHFGTIWDVTRKESEIEKTYLQNKQWAENMDQLYLDNCKGKLTKDTLNKLKNDERGYLTAQDCLKYGLCDVIIEDDLKQKEILEKEQIEYDKGFEKYLKDKAKKVKEEANKEKKKVKSKLKKK